MKIVDFTPVAQCIAAIAMCCFALYLQSVYPHSNVIPFISLGIGVLVGSALSCIDSRPGKEYTTIIVIGLFVLAWILVPLVVFNYFEGDKATERRMWFNIYGLLFAPFIGFCYDCKYAWNGIKKAEIFISAFTYY